MSDTTIYGSVRLRPIRFGYLVRPNDKKSLDEIFRINACLWGGIFNPIIPYFDRVPAWWDRQPYRTIGAKQILNGYLDYFEPDILVECEKGLADGLGYDAERVISLSSILERENGDQANRFDRGYGQNMFDLYKYLFQKEFQFVKRRKSKIASISTKQKDEELFVGAIFGNFPNQRNLSYLKKGFQEAFDPTFITLDTKTIIDIYQTQPLSPLWLTAHEIDVSYNENEDAILYVLDAKDPRDLIDYWNLRATHSYVRAVPIQWIEELSPLFKDFINRNYRPLPGNPYGVKIRTNVMFGRSLSEEKAKKLFDDYLKVAEPDAVTLQMWYPTIWIATPDIMMRKTKPVLSAKTSDIEYPLDEDKLSLRFPSLSPSWAEKYGGNYRWANVVRFKNYGDKGKIATVFPSNYRDSSYPSLGFGTRVMISNTEGVTFFPEWTDSNEYWELSKGQRAFEEWFKKQKITTEISPAGRSTQQIIETLDGFWGVGKIATKGVIELLNEMANNPVTHSMHQSEFVQKIKKANKGRIFSDRASDVVIDRKVVQLGMEVKCTKCSAWSWYTLKEIDYGCTCNNCLRDFPFPIKNPTSKDTGRWSYRVVGPFAWPKYAEGGYSAALAIRFFNSILGLSDSAQITWSAGMKLIQEDKTESEADYIIWYQRKAEFVGHDYQTDMVFGEAKSFGKEAFLDEDIDRLKVLAQRFPGSILTFSTMKAPDQLTPDEINRIRTLAEWGREQIVDGERSRAPVIVLTGVELFAEMHLRDTWQKQGGEHGVFAGYNYLRFENLRTLADLTQQLYLGMESYSTWQRKKWATKRAAKKTKTPTKKKSAKTKASKAVASKPSKTKTAAKKKALKKPAVKRKKK